MKHILIIFVLLALLYACKSEGKNSEMSIKCNCDKLILDNLYNHFYIENRKSPFTGMCFKLNKNGDTLETINYNKGNIPELSAQTPMNELIKLRNFLEYKKEDIRNQNVRQYSDPSDPEKMAMDIRNHQDNPDERLDHGFTR